MLTAARFASKVACEANSTFGRRSISTILTNVSFFSLNKLNCTGLNNEEIH